MTAPLALLLVAIPAAIGMAGDADRNRTTVAAGGPDSTAAPATTAPAATVPVPTTAVPEPTTTTTTTTTSVRPTTTTTTGAPRSTTTTTTTPATTTTTKIVGVPPGPTCEASMFQATMTADKAAYKPGETVTMTVTYKNVSGQTCYWVSPFLSVSIYNSTGKQVNQPTGVWVDMDAWQTAAAGASDTHTLVWDQVYRYLDGPEAQVPPGTYHVVDHSGQFGEAKGTILLVAA